MMEVIWFLVVLSCVLCYVLLDGPDLGVGILSLFQRDKHRRHEQVEVVATVWDASETWIVMTGVALWGGFPQIYGAVLQFMYPVLFTMLFGLILRGFSTEMISARGENVPERWNLAFGIGSLVAAIMQGMALGSLTSAITIKDWTNASQPFAFFTWYSVLFAVWVVVAYIALGYAMLNFHQLATTKEQVHGFWATVATAILLVVAVIAINWTAAPLNLSEPWRVAGFISMMVIAVIGVVLAGYNFLNQKHNFYSQAMPIVGLVMATISAALAFTVTHAPMIMPGANGTTGVTLTTTASDPSTYHFLIVGVGIWLPLMWYFIYFSHRVLLRKGKYGLWK